MIRRQFRPALIEHLETRIVLDCTGVLAGGAIFEESEFVREHTDGTLQFASLRVGATLDEADFGEIIVLDNNQVVPVREHELKVSQVKSYLHGFANSLGTDLIIETQDIRVSPWGYGSGSTTDRFEDFISDYLESHESCKGLRFSGAVQFELPGEGGEFFTGGFLSLQEGELDSLLRGGDIVEIVESYEIVSDGEQTTLIVTAQLGEMTFVINDDQSLTDEFDRVWFPITEYDIVDPDAVDQILGDIDGNGTVEFADFLILSKNFGSQAEEGDLNNDGEVNFADFLILSNNFGATRN